MPAKIYEATPRKLPKGDWGVAVQEPLPRGEIVECVVTTKSGKSWEGAYLVVWSGQDYCLAADADNAGKYKKEEADKPAAVRDKDYFINTVFSAAQRKLKGGDWGVAIQEPIPTGTIVRCRVGASRTPIEYRVIWSNDEFSIAADYDPYYGMDSKSPVKKALNEMR